MILVRTADPSVEPLTVGDAMAYLRCISPQDAALVTSLIASARDVVEHAIGKALITQQWKMYTDCWTDKLPYRGTEQNIARPAYLTPPADQYARYFEVRLPRSPLIAVDLVQYYDSTNTLQTLNSSNYTVRPSSSYSHGGIVLALGYSWPAIADRPDAIQIAFTAGYGAAATNVPPRIVQALRFLVKHYYDNRDSVVVERATVDELPMTVRDLLISSTTQLVG